MTVLDKIKALFKWAKPCAGKKVAKAPEKKTKKS